MPLMDYFNAGGDPMAAIVKQIQGALNSIGGRIDTPKSSGMLGNFGAYDDPSYAPPLSPDPVKTNLTPSGWGQFEPGFDPTGTRQGGPGTQPDWKKRLPPKRQRREAEVGRGRGGIEEWPEGELDMTKLFNTRAPRPLREGVREEISNQTGPRYNPEMASPENPYTVGDWLAKWLLETGGVNLQGKWEKDNYEPGAGSRSGVMSEGFASALPDVPPQALMDYSGTWLEKYPDLIRSHRRNAIREHGGIRSQEDVGTGKSRLENVWPEGQVEMLWNYFYPKYLESGRYNK